jgi:predicted Zn-dependent protease
LPELSAEQRLVALRRRWEAERTPTASVSLAEEYRRVGSYAEARSVLETCLKAFPQHLSALIALGRVRLEAGDAAGAAQAFERVLGRDPMQLVANKMLAEAYLLLGRPAEAEQRLRIYALLNDRDPELVLLQRRLRQALAPEEPARQSAPEPPAPVPLGVAQAPEELIFDLGSSGSPPTAPPEQGSVTPVEPAAPAGGEIFAGLGGEVAAALYRQAFARGDVFGAPPAAPPSATVTLGDLYLRQGHPGDAKDIFAAVLERDPENPAARQGLLAARTAVEGRGDRLRRYLERLQRSRPSGAGLGDVR